MPPMPRSVPASALSFPAWAASHPPCLASSHVTVLCRAPRSSSFSSEKAARRAHSGSASQPLLIPPAALRNPASSPCGRPACRGYPLPRLGAGARLCRRGSRMMARGGKTSRLAIESRVFALRPVLMARELTRMHRGSSLAALRMHRASSVLRTREACRCICPDLDFSANKTEQCQWHSRGANAAPKVFAPSLRGAKRGSPCHTK